MSSDCHRPVLSVGERRGDAALLIAAALISVSEGALFVGLPFLTLHLDGTASQVGLVGGLMKLAYVVGLLGTRRGSARFEMRSVAFLGCAGLAASAAMLAGASTYRLVLYGAAAYGLATSLFWPPIVGLLSVGLHGMALNRRLGRFNFAWSAGMLIGPAIGGVLFTLAPRWPFVFVAGCNLLAGVLVFSVAARKPRAAPAPPARELPGETGERTESIDRPGTFLRMARVALLMGYVVTGLLRYQLPILARDMRISEATFGLIGACLSASLVAAFVVLGRLGTWHNRKVLLWAGQVLMAACLLVPVVASAAWQLVACMLVVGPGIGLSYASHLFYRTSSGSDRAEGMTAHEVLLSVGFLLGAFGGGLVAEWTGNRWLYLVGTAVVLLGVAIQMALWWGGRNGVESGSRRARRVLEQGS